MTVHVHDPATHAGGGRPHTTASSAAPLSSRPAWLLPGLLIAIVAGGLVVAGVVPLSTVLYAGLFGGMMLMCMGGHGHGGHGSAGHAGHGRVASDDREDLSPRSPGSQLPDAGSVRGLDKRADSDPMTSRNVDDDKHSSHGCH